MMFFLGYLIPVILAVAVGLGLATAWVLQYRLLASVTPEWRLAVIVLVVGMGALLSVALTSRNLDETGGGHLVFYDDLAGGFTASRWFSLLLVMASLIEVVRGWLQERHRAAVDPARPLLVAMLAYYLGTTLIQAVASDHPEFSARTLYVPVLLTAVFHQRPRSLALILGVARIVILVLMIGSLAGVWIRPNFVMHRPDPGWLPGVDWRLYGLASHANSLGPIALLGILLEMHSPARWRATRWSMFASAGAVFVLAQSKTVWGAAVLLLVMVWLPLVLLRRPKGAQDVHHFRRQVLALASAIAALLLLVGVLVAFDVVGLVERRGDLLSLTGRTRIWDITLSAWRDNLLFGYGAAIWGPERQAEYQMFYVGQAHNQFVQTLGEAGLAGLALLVAYLGVLFAAALRTLVASRGITLTLLTLMLVRCITEAPMRAEGILSWNTFVHALLLLTACHFLRNPRPDIVAARHIRTLSGHDDTLRSRGMLDAF